MKRYAILALVSLLLVACATSPKEYAANIPLIVWNWSKMLSTGIAQRKLYFADHPKVKSLGRQFADLLQEYLKATEQETLFIGVVDGKLVHSGGIPGPDQVRAWVERK